MRDDVVELKNKIILFSGKVDNYEEEIKRLRHTIKLFKEEKFGSKSESYQEDLQLIFNEIGVEAQGEQLLLEQEQISYVRKKGRQKKKPFPETLPREDVIIDIPEADKVCPHDGTRLKEIGEDVVEKLKNVPAQSTIIVERKKKYACPCCELHLVQAKSNSILPKTIATPDILSFLMFSKFFQGLPLYRLEELYKLQSIHLTRGTMTRWLIQVSEKLIPIWNVLEERVLECGYMAIDATQVQVLKEKGRKPQDDSFMWVRGSPELGIVLFDYNISGGGKIAKGLIGDFKGGVQADAHKGYGALDKKELELLGCMMHARRRFHKAWLGGGKKPGLAENGLKMFKRLYRFEKAYKEQILYQEERHRARLKEVKQYLEKIKKWCEKKKSKAPKQSPVGNTINYFLNEYDELSVFLTNGRYEIDNGLVERMICKFAIGRNNWMFSDTIDGTHVSSILYSIALTAKENNKDPFKVMTEIFKRLPAAETIDDYEALADLLTK
ncbi:MAG: IS66 family transposase [Bdellovibrionales bacterium]|nr:IS66 family transposase [Bdellovibrionales bacterium]